MATNSKTRRKYHKRRSLSASQLTPPMAPMPKSTNESPVVPAATTAESSDTSEDSFETIEDIEISPVAKQPEPEKSKEAKRRRSSSNSQRRSSFMGSGMRKERIQFHETGCLDSNGQPTYVLRVTEAQGFRWNPMIYDLHDCGSYFDNFLE